MSVLYVRDKNGNLIPIKTIKGKDGRDGLDATPVTPLFANSTAECTDTTKMYVLPDGYIYAYILTKVTSESGENILPSLTLTAVVDTFVAVLAGILVAGNQRGAENQSQDQGQDLGELLHVCFLLICVEIEKRRCFQRRCYQ